MKALKGFNPFIDEESNSFIGVANIYLKALFYVPKLDYIVPIINTQGEVMTTRRLKTVKTEPFPRHPKNDLYPFFCPMDLKRVCNLVVKNATSN